MKEYTKDLGKVVLTPEGIWDNKKEYEKLSIVYDESNKHAYVSYIDVPIGIDITDSRYWMPLNVSGYSDSNMIILNNLDENGDIISYTLEEAIKSITSVARRKGSILSFYNSNLDRNDVDGRWEIWQFNGLDINTWENIDNWINIYYNHNKFIGWFKDYNSLITNSPTPTIGQYAYVGCVLNGSVIYRCNTNGLWENTNLQANDYIKIVIGDNITIGSNGNWIVDGQDSGIPASIKGDSGQTPYMRNNNNIIEYSYDNINWLPISDKIAAWFRISNGKLQISRDEVNWVDFSDYLYTYFRWQATIADSQANNVGRLQMSKDGKNWTTLSNDIINNLHISKYVGVNDNLPTTDIAEGTIYAKGPYYSDEDLSQTNPIYRIFVYAWKDNTLAWQDNGSFTSIAAGVVQTIGNSETEIMSQKAVTDLYKEIKGSVNYHTIIGKGTTSVSNIHYNIIPNHIYKINFKKGNWDTSTFDAAYDQYNKFSIDITLNDGSTVSQKSIAIKAHHSYSDFVPRELIFTAPKNTNYIKILIRALENEVIEYTLEDVTDDINQYNYFIGNDNFLSFSRVYLEKDKVYKLTLPITEWELPKDILDYQQVFEVLYYNESNESIEIIQASDFTKLAREYSFTAPITGVYYIGGRAKDNIRIPYTISEINLSNNMVTLSGNNDNIVTEYIKLYEGVTYTFKLPNESWDVSGVTSNDVNYFQFYYKDETNTTQMIKIWYCRHPYFNAFTFTAPMTTNYRIAIRATAGVFVPFYVYPIENSSKDELSIVGNDYAYTSTKISGLSSNSYIRIQVLNNNDWNTTSLPPQYDGQKKFEFGYKYTDGTSHYPIGVGLDEEALDYYDVHIPENVDVNNIIIGGRAVKGNIINFAIMHYIPDFNLDYDKNVIHGYGNNDKIVYRYINLRKDISYTFYLPNEPWDVSGITNTDVNCFGFYYKDESGASHTIKKWYYRYDYFNSFSFTAPITGTYVIYFRATIDEKVTFYVYPSNEGSSELDVFKEQIYKAKNLGFKRNPDTVTEGYIPTLPFMHISDTHCTSSDFLDPFKRTVSIFNKLSTNDINKGNNLKFLLHTGDVRNHAFSNGYSFFEPIISSLNKNIYVTPGNHDVGHHFDATIAGTDEQIYTQMIAPMLDRWSLKSDGDGNPHPEGKSYYFTDFTDEKIRLIALYEWESDMELDSTDNTKLKYNRSYRAFRQEQIDWFIDSLLTVPAGYGVIIAKHQPEGFISIIDDPFCSAVAIEGADAMSSYCDVNMIAEIVQEFIDRGTINKTFNQTGGVVTNLNVSADFRNLNENVEFICYCSGHTHQDIVKYLKDYPKQLELTIGCNNLHYTSGTDLLQEESDKSKNVINVYNVDRNRGEITIVRIGADFSNTGQNRSHTTIKYRK